MDETIRADFDAELTRLSALHIPDEDLELARRYYSDKERKSMPASAFCGPGRTFPVESQEDVDNAAGLAGHAANPNAVRACIKRKAKAGGWSLPDSWKDGKADRAMQPESLDLYLPIVRIDKEKREVILTATAERKDAYRTVIGFDGSSEAFGKWRGNVREMHDPHKAVGRALVIDPHPNEKEIDVTLRISNGAEDTWQKVLDGTLTGASIGARNGKWGKKIIDGEEIPFLERYELVELSLVDNPACPGCDIKIVRNDGIATEVLDNAEETPATPEPDVTRAGARISHATQSDLHSLRDGHLQGAQKTAGLCACDECIAMCAIFSPDGDDDIDLVDSLDMDGDGGKPDGGSMNYALASSIERQLNPLLTRVHAMLSSHAARPNIQQPTVEFSTEPIERRIADVERAFDTRLTEVRSLVSEVKALAEKIAAQPAPGGPIMTPVDKRLATSPQQGYNQQDDIAALSRASQIVPFDQDAQIALAAEIIKRQNRG
jgi:hypothetical protein